MSDGEPIGISSENRQQNFNALFTNTSLEKVIQLHCLVALRCKKAQKDSAKQANH